MKTVELAKRLHRSEKLRVYIINLYLELSKAPTSGTGERLVSVEGAQ